ncbi:hypothetical protein RUM43_001638 [Polyplax serrata]|uniref:PDZ domain-containing protein n=1 Tax=Polyplax serrata TaxID=468196 RepID=A0AAN8SEM7_POLSC
MVDLGGYVIILVETKDKKIKLYGSPADKADLEVGDEILEVNGRSMEEATHTEVISHIHQCIRSRTICLRVKRKSGNRLERAGRRYRNFKTLRQPCQVSDVNTLSGEPGGRLLLLLLPSAPCANELLIMVLNTSDPFTVP